MNAYVRWYARRYAQRLNKKAVPGELKIGMAPHAAVWGINVNILSKKVILRRRNVETRQRCPARASWKTAVAGGWNGFTGMARLVNQVAGTSTAFGIVGKVYTEAESAFACGGGPARRRQRRFAARFYQ